MWLLTNRTPFAADRTWIRDRDGAEVWIVVVRATFVIESDGRLALATEQKPVVRVPEFSGVPGLSSLIQECDFVERKSATDVLVWGSAYAVRKPQRSVDVRLQVANIDKTLRVVGDREWGWFFPGINFGRRARTFKRMPIRYERAWGGVDEHPRNAQKTAWDPRNPIGRGVKRSRWSRPGEPMPNVVRAGSGFWKGARTPVGFSAIARNWQPRLVLAGTYDGEWEATRNPLLPKDFDDEFYQCAPADQRVPGFLRGGERVALENMTPEGGLTFRVPRVALGFRTRFSSDAPMEHRASLHTLLIEPDLRRVQVVWHTHLACHHKVYKLQETVVSLKHRTRASSERWVGVFTGDRL